MLWIRRAFTSPSLTGCKGGDKFHHPEETRGSGGHDLHRRDRACKSSESRCRASVEKIKGGKEQELLKVNVCNLRPPSSVSNPSWEGNAPSYLKGSEWLAPSLTSPSEVVRDSCTQAYGSTCMWTETLIQTYIHIYLDGFSPSSHKVSSSNPVLSCFCFTPFS